MDASVTPDESPIALVVAASEADDTPTAGVFAEASPAAADNAFALLLIEERRAEVTSDEVDSIPERGDDDAGDEESVDETLALAF
ncbi:MAG: hypothetical protein AAF266_05470 [Planctomycetota bacterium]